MELLDEEACLELRSLEQALVERGSDLALFLVFDRPDRAAERSGLARTFFAERCVSDTQLEQTIDAFRSIGSYVELFHGEEPLLLALAERRLQTISRRLKVIYNGIEGGIGADAFAPGRKALIPCVADSYKMLCANSGPYACALGRHKFHYFTVLGALGVRTPSAWHYRQDIGWVGQRRPADGTKVIAKSTYESWSVGVTEESVFVVDEKCEGRVAALAGLIGQPVTVQEFVPGAEVCVPVVSHPGLIVTPPVETILAKAPRNPESIMTIDDNLHSGRVVYERFCDHPDTIKQLRTDAARVFSLLELEAFARIDFRVSQEGTPWVTDVGVSPGLSVGSSAYSSFAQLGFDHASFLRVVVAASLASHGLLR